MSEHLVQRLMMFEVYEAGEESLLLATSDPTEARAAMSPGDRVVKRHWLREGCVTCDPGLRCCAAHGVHVAPHKGCILR